MQLRERHHLFVGRDLEDRIGRGVHDPCPGARVLGAELVEHGGAAANHVADARPARAGAELVEQDLRKAVRIGGERRDKVNAGEFPVPGRAVLARRLGLQDAVGRRRMRFAGQPGNGGQVSKARALEVRQVKTAHAARRVRERVRALVAVLVGVGRLADTHAVEHENAGAPAHPTAAWYTRGRR